MHKEFDRVLSPLYKRQEKLIKIQKIIDLINSGIMPNMLDKIKKISEINAFQKYLLTLFDNEYKKESMNHIELLTSKVKIIVEFKKKWYGYFMPEFTENDHLNLIILMDECLSNESLSSIVLFYGYTESIKYYKELYSKEEKDLYKRFVQIKILLKNLYIDTKDDFDNYILQHEVNFII